MTAAIEGVLVPDVPKHPRVQRKLPAPFQRPSIAVGGGHAAIIREWRHVLACEIKQGDIVPGIGCVDTVEETVSASGGEWTVTLIGGADNRRVYPGFEQVFAFVPKAGSS